MSKRAMGFSGLGKRSWYSELRYSQLTWQHHKLHVHYGPAVLNRLMISMFIKVVTFNIQTVTDLLREKKLLTTCWQDLRWLQ